MPLPQLKVSVISTVYNGEPYFERSIPSILAQKYENFEYILVNDGSTDKTQEYLTKLALQDSRVRVFSPGRLGRAKALNYAVEKAQGIYIANQDFDDTSHPERLERQIQFLETHPKVGLVGGFYNLIDENRQEKYVRVVPTEHEQIMSAMTKYIPTCHTIATFRKQAWKEAGGYPEVDDIEDLRLWIAFVKQGWHLANIPEVLGEHRVYSDSFWHRNFKYRQRQQELAAVQWQAVKDLNFPWWYGVYPLSKYVYSYLPNYWKRLVRRNLSGTEEKDLVQRSSK